MPDTRLRDALDTLYRLFDAPVPRSIEGCPCCLEKRGVGVLLARPLRELTGQQLWSYVSGVFLTVGSERDFRYLLPRILELAVDSCGDLPDTEVVLGKLALADWQAWPADERAAIREFLDLWFERELARDIAEAAEWAPGWEAEAVLCGAARAGLALAPWLERLTEPDAEPVLTDLQVRAPRGLSAFWKDVPEGLAELCAFLDSRRGGR